MQIKDIDKVPPEAHKLLSHIVLVEGRAIASREASPNGLVDVHHVRQTMPAPVVPNWFPGSGLPQDRAVLVKEAQHGRAPGLDKVISKERRTGGQGIVLTPPVSQIRMLLSGFGWVVGQNQKKSSPSPLSPTSRLPA